MALSNSSDRLAKALLLLNAIFSFLIIYLFNGTGEEADSYHHYLIAHYAPQYLELYFDHWGKPIFTLLSSPFAQFGFIGSKVFNVICSLFSAWLAYLILKEWKTKWAAWVIPLFFFIPLNFIVSFSSFTEPLFACSLLFAILLMARNMTTYSLIIVSFLPLMRSEGLIIIGVFGIFCIAKRHFKLIPLLFAGQLLFGIAGWLFFEKSILWLANEIPYASLNSPYGHGNFTHFFEQLYYICGLVILPLFILGLVYSIVKMKNQSMLYTILIVLTFVSFFTFHLLSWQFGLFNSMGLKRVFGAVTPLMAIVSIYGVENIFKKYNQSSAFKLAPIVLSALAGLFLLTKSPAAIDWKNDMNLSKAQLAANEAGEIIEQIKSSSDIILFADRYLAESIDLDIYNQEEFLLLTKESIQTMKKGDLIIWDNWHAPVDFGIELEELIQLKNIEQIENLKKVDGKREINYVIFRCVN